MSEFKRVTPFDPKTPAEYESSLVFSRSFWIETDSPDGPCQCRYWLPIPGRNKANPSSDQQRRTLGNVKTTAHGKYICRKVDRNFFIKFVHIPDATKAGTTGHFWPLYLCGGVLLGMSSTHFTPWVGPFQAYKITPQCLDTIDSENSYRSHQLRTDSKLFIRKSETIKNSNRFRLERFENALSGTGSWEVPGAVLNGIGLNFRANISYRFWLEFSTLWKLGCWRWGGRNWLYNYAPCFSLFLNG